MIRVIRWPFARDRRQVLDPVDVQGNVLRAYGHPVAAYVVVHFRDPAGGRALLRAALGEITHGDTWVEKPDATLNVAFTHEGLAALGLPERLLRSFPEAFRQGMAGRAAVLGDTGTSAPEHWDAGLGTGEVHAVFSIYASGATALDTALDRLRGWCSQHRTDEVAVHVADRLPDRKEHFGYADGMGQPAMEGSGDPVRGEGCHWASCSAASSTTTATPHPRRAARWATGARSWCGASCTRTSPRSAPGRHSRPSSTASTTNC